MNGQTLGVAAGGPPGGVGDIPAATRNWRAVVRILRSPMLLSQGIAHDLITTIFPGDCRVCARPLTQASSIPVCSTCLHGLVPRAHTGCRRCGDRLDLANDLEDLSFRGMECLACRLAPPGFTRAVSFGTYEDELRVLIHLLKYEHMRPLTRVLGQHLAKAIVTLEDEAARHLLVIAVPLHPYAEKIRGYNQARLLADEALRAMNRTHSAWTFEPAHAALVRQKSTEHQFALSRRARRRNLAGAFAVPLAQAARIKGHQVLLIDDVLTTGATARECAKVLLQAGAEKVWVATVARACGADSPQKRSQQNLTEAVAPWGTPDTHQQATGD